MMTKHPCDQAIRGHQAVVLIHGIGNQRPMDTLRSFVDAAWDKSAENLYPGSRPLIWSKPDLTSDSYELRRLTTDFDKNCVRTDFFEFYWAHMMEGTSFSHVLSWAKGLLLRAPWKVPGPLLLAYLGLWIVILFFAFFAVAGYLVGELKGTISGFAVPGSYIFLVGVLYWYLREKLIVPIVGDASRYLSPAPANVKVRHEIRKAGVELLKSLHDKGKYQRIILVGHSLGSVIGYDVLTHLWPHYNRMYTANSSPGFGLLEEMEELAHQIESEAAKLEVTGWRGDWPSPEGELKTLVETFRAGQLALAGLFRESGNPWIVSDFVTLGSPLTHGDVLLARDLKDLRQRQENREFPVCPPFLETPTGEKDQRFSYNPPHEADDPQPEGRRVLHFAGLFSTVRWTNLYFPARFIFWGDLIGGPLGAPFGYGVRDIPVPADDPAVAFLSHTKYWLCEQGDCPAHVAALRDALDLSNVEALDRKSHCP